MHQLTHVFGFAANLYQYYQTENLEGKKMDTTIKKDKTLGYEITSSRVVKVARSYFKCPTMTGVKLEDQGGAQAKYRNWDRVMLGDAVMTGHYSPH